MTSLAKFYSNSVTIMLSSFSDIMDKIDNNALSIIKAIPIQSSLKT